MSHRRCCARVMGGAVVLAWCIYATGQVLTSGDIPPPEYEVRAQAQLEPYHFDHSITQPPAAAAGGAAPARGGAPTAAGASRPSNAAGVAAAVARRQKQRDAAEGARHPEAPLFEMLTSADGGASKDSKAHRTADICIGTVLEEGLFRGDNCTSMYLEASKKAVAKHIENPWLLDGKLTKLRNWCKTLGCTVQETSDARILCHLYKTVACPEDGAGLHRVAGEADLLLGMYPRIDVALSDVVFAVPTMKRPNNAEYLLATVESLLQHANTRPENIFLMSTGPEDHAEYEGVLKKHSRLGKVEHTLQPLKRVEYELPAIAALDAEAIFFQNDNDEGTAKKAWRMSEARDFFFLTRSVLNRSAAQYIIFNQDDGKWARKPELVDAPVQSLYHHRPAELESTPDEERRKARADKRAGRRGAACPMDGACRCGLGCGLVSMVFRRDVLKQFLNSLVVSHQGVPNWKLKPIDLLLSDFLRAYGHEWPATRSVQHMGVQSSYSSETVLLADDFAGNVTGYEHRARPPLSKQPRFEEGRLYSCSRPPFALVVPEARSKCEFLYQGSAAYMRAPHGQDSYGQVERTLLA